MFDHNLNEATWLLSSEFICQRSPLHILVLQVTYMFNMLNLVYFNGRRMGLPEFPFFLPITTLSTYCYNFVLFQTFFDLVDRKMYQHLGYHISFSRSIIIRYIFIIQFYINGKRYFTEEEPRLVKFLKQNKCTVTTYTFNTMVAPSFWNTQCSRAVGGSRCWESLHPRR